MTDNPRANALRADARAAGAKKFTDANPCGICGEREKYTINGGCVACGIAKGRLRYATQTREQREAQKQKDRARYQRRLDRASGIEVEASEAHVRDSRSALVTEEE